MGRFSNLRLKAALFAGSRTNGLLIFETGSKTCSGLKESLPECRVPIAGDGHQFGELWFVTEIGE